MNIVYILLIVIIAFTGSAYGQTWKPEIDYKSDITKLYLPNNQGKVSLAAVYKHGEKRFDVSRSEIRADTTLFLMLAFYTKHTQKKIVYYSVGTVVPYLFMAGFGQAGAAKAIKFDIICHLNNKKNDNSKQ